MVTKRMTNQSTASNVKSILLLIFASCGFLVFDIVVWERIGYNDKLSHLFAIISSLVLMLIYPYWFSMIGFRIRKIVAWLIVPQLTYVFLGLMLIVAVMTNRWIGIHLSGYYNAVEANTMMSGSTESIALGNLVTIVECIAALAVYLACLISGPDRIPARLKDFFFW